MFFESQDDWESSSKYVVLVVNVNAIYHPRDSILSAVLKTRTKVNVGGYWGEGECPLSLKEGSEKVSYVHRKLPCTTTIFQDQSRLREPSISPRLASSSNPCSCFQNCTRNVVTTVLFSLGSFLKQPQTYYWEYGQNSVSSTAFSSI